MRLNPTEQTAIHHAVRKYFGDTAQVWLFGSRVDDTKKGGDIDLYVETDVEQTEILMREIKLRGELMRPLQERKVDIVVRTRNSNRHLPIYDVARATGIQL